MSASTKPRNITETGLWYKLLIACALVVLPIVVVNRPGYAWKPNTHIFLAEEALRDAIDDGMVSIYQTEYVNGRKLDKLGDYEVNPQLLDALRNFPEQYRAGVLGPDAYPDILTGQQVIHPDNSDSSGSITNAWLQYLWDLSSQPGNDSPQIKAFVAGFLTHAAGDIYGHTFVNNFTGDAFTFTPPDNAIKHIVLEGYVGKRTPLTVSLDNQFVTENNVSIDGVEDFIYRNMVDAKPDSFLAQNLLVGDTAKFSVPRIYSKMREGLKQGIDAYYATKADFDRRYNEKIRAARACRVLNFSCSKTVLYAQAAAIQVQKAAYITANGLQVTYKEYWVDDIDSGLRAWPRFSHEMAKALVFNSQGVDTQRAKAIAEEYVYDHLLSMAGAPDALGATLSFINNVLSAILPTFLVEAINEMKEDLLNYLLKHTFGLTIDEIKDYLTNPERYFDSVLNSGGGGQNTTLGMFNAQELKIYDSGYSNLEEKFDYERVPAAYNTVTMTKLLLMSQSGINQLLNDLGSSSQLNEPNAMLGFIRTLDGDNQWHINPEEMILARNCNTYKKVFMRQTGETTSRPCASLESFPP